MATSWEATPEGRAAMYGWSLAVINSNAELKRIFSQATSQNWTSDRFVAAVRDTQWFKKHSDTYRQASILKAADPATYNRQVDQARAQTISMAANMGAFMSPTQAQAISQEAMMYGWTQDELKQHLVAFVKAGTGGRYAGNAATFQQQYSQMGEQYGVAIAPSVMASWVKQSELGNVNSDYVRQYMVAQASSRYPSLGDRLKGGETMQQIADPYIQSYAKTLEVNPQTVKLSDPLVQQALASKDDKGKPTTLSVWQFEQNLRNDPRYMKTQQAQDQAMNMGRKVLSDFGLIS